MAPWTAASGQDANSLFANPDFVDPNGADGILGYTTAAGGYNGGRDDNFSLSAGSPAIGAGDTAAAPPTDIAGTPRVGIADIGAYEFIVSPNPPPKITATTPSVVDSSGTTAAPFQELQLTLNEPLNPIDADAPAAFQLLGPGALSAPGYTLVPEYMPGSTILTISVVVPGGGELPSGDYQFTVDGSLVHDMSGFELAGDGATAGTDYVRSFSIQDQQTTTSVTSNFSSGSTYGQTVILTATVSAVSGTPSGTVQFLVDGTDQGSPVNLANGTASISISTLDAGDDAITADYTSDSSGYADSATNPSNAFTQSVSPALLTVTAVNQSMVYGDAGPALTVDYTGFVNGETLATSGVTGSADVSASVTSASPVGSYPIFVANGSLTAQNYVFAFVNGTFTVTPPQTATWSGGGADDRWSTAANWSALSAPMPGNDLVFQGAAQTTTDNDLLPGTSLDSIALASPGFVLAGNLITLASASAPVVTLAADSGTIQLPIALGSNATFAITDPQGSLADSGNIDNGGYNLTFDTSSSQASTLSGSISGAGGFIKTGSGEVVLSGTNSFTGETQVLAGTLVATTANALAAGSSLTVAAGGIFVFDPSQAVTGSVVASVVSAANVAAVPDASTPIVAAGAIDNAAVAAPAVSTVSPASARQVENLSYLSSTPARQVENLSYVPAASTATDLAIQQLMNQGAGGLVAAKPLPAPLPAWPVRQAGEASQRARDAVFGQGQAILPSRDAAWIWDLASSQNAEDKSSQQPPDAASIDKFLELGAGETEQ